MNSSLSGQFIREQRRARGLTQDQLADILHVTDKAVSKWENGKGYPDRSLIQPLAAALGLSVTELLTGQTCTNQNVSADLRRMAYYVCPVCGNVITAMGQAALSCHGVQLTPCIPRAADDRHTYTVQTVEEDYYITFHHEQSKSHYISFAAAVGDDRLQLIKLYPEAQPAVRFPKRGIIRLFFYCNQDGLFEISPTK